MWIWVILKKIVQRSDQLVHPLYVAQPWIELGIHKQCPAHLLRNERHIQYVVVWFVNFGPLRCANQSCFWLCVHSVVQLRAAGMMHTFSRPGLTGTTCRRPLAQLADAQDSQLYEKSSAVTQSNT